MDYLLDTCLLSEFTRKYPESKVVQWLDGIAEERLFISVITVGEIQHGIERLPDSRRKTELKKWMNDRLLSRFGSRILPLDVETLFLWGSLTARMEKSGQPVGVMDALIISTALQYNLIIATRNISDFIPCGVQVINPWE